MSIDRFLDKARQVLAAGTALSMVALSTTPPAQADWLDTTAGWFQQRADDGADFFGSLMGGTVSFAAAVAKAGCNAGPYDGKDLTGILAVSFSNADIAMKSYGKGVELAENAAGIKSEHGRELFEGIDGLLGRADYGNSFRNFSEVDHTSDRNEVLVAELKQQAAQGFSAAAQQDLTQAIVLLNVANELQAQAVVGLLLIAAYVKMAHDYGQEGAVISLLSRELSSNGADDSMRTLVGSPDALLKLVSNFAQAFNLTSSLKRAVEFDEAEEALLKRGIEEDLSVVSGFVEQRAQAAARPEAALPFRPGGDTIRVMLSSSGLVDDRISGIAVDFLSMACGGVFGQPSQGAGPTSRAPIEQQPTFGRNEIIQVQQSLIDLGYLKGRADGAWGPMSRGAMQDFTRERGLANTSGEPTFALLEELRRVKGGAPEIEGAPLSSALQEISEDAIPPTGDVIDEMSRDAKEAIDGLKNLFTNPFGGGSNN